MKKFEINNRIRVDCEYQKTRSGFRHVAKLYVDGKLKHTAKATYQNRTWEAYTYETVLLKVINGANNVLTETETKQCLDFAKKEGNPFGAVVMAAKMGEILTDNKAEANKWKVRMMKAGLGENVSFPDDWDTLSEEEKERRLNGALDQLKK